MGARNAMAIDLGRRRLRAVHGRTTGPSQNPRQANSKSGASLTIKRVLIEDIPADVNIDDPVVVGQWIGQRLRSRGFPIGPATIALGREHVGLKRITLPSAVEDELPDMTRLAMQRELPFDADTAVIDFVPVDRTPTSTTVLAVAVPQRVLEFAHRMAKSAGLSIDRISLRTMGAAALMNTLADQNDSGQPASDNESKFDSPSTSIADHSTSIATKTRRTRASMSALAVDVTGEGVEFCLVLDGTVRFSRAAEVPQPQDELAVAEAVVTETRRTWMSYRIGEPPNASDELTAVIMGDRRVSAYAAGPLGDMLKIPVCMMEDHPLIDPAGHDLDRLWPLAGLLLEPALGGEMIDFSQPRKAPDMALRRRIRVYAAMLAGVLLLGLGWTAARLDLTGQQSSATQLTEQVQSGSPGYARYARYYRDLYKLRHLTEWSKIQADWLKHAAYLCTIVPPADKAVLDSWTGTLETRGVVYDGKADKWSADEQLTIVIDGEARDREIADAFREALTQNSLYNTSTTGADAKGGKRMPFGFTYRLRTKVGAPVDRGDRAAAVNDANGKSAADQKPSANVADVNSPEASHAPAADGDAESHSPTAAAQSPPAEPTQQ